MSIKRVRVVIMDSRWIPTVGKGPINRPISITIDQYNMLVSLGYKISKVDSIPTKIPVQPKEETKVEEPTKVEPVVEEKEEVLEPEHVEQEEEIVEEVEVNEEESTVEPEVEQEEEVIEEETEATEEVDGNVVYTMEDMKEATKKDLKAVLDKRDVKYGYSDTLKELKKAVIDSNPQ